MFSIKDARIDLLYHLIHDVYNSTVSVKKSSKKEDISDTKLASTLTELESHLKMTLRKSEHGRSSQRVIISPLDEFQYWQEVSQRAKSSSDRERADNFYKQFLPLVKLYEQIHIHTFPELFEIIERTQDVYDDVWKQLEFEPLYPQERMQSLLDVTGLFFILI
jgi:hypothetical protein